MNDYIMELIPINSLDDLVIISKEKNFNRCKNEFVKELLKNNNIFSQINHVIRYDSIVTFILTQQIWVEFEFLYDGSIIIVGGNNYFDTFIRASDIPNSTRNFSFDENINELEDDILKCYIQLALNLSQHRELSL